jgi:hypothetical protein
MAAQREKVDILPIEKLIYIPANHKAVPQDEIKAEIKENDKPSENVDDKRMMVVEKYVSLDTGLILQSKKKREMSKAKIRKRRNR